MNGNGLTDVDGKLARAGITIDAPGLSGDAEAWGAEINLRTPGAELLHRALGNSGLSPTHHIALTHTTPPTDAVTVSVPVPRPGNNTLLLVHDSTGALSWHQPDDIALRSSDTVPRMPWSAAAPAVSFTIPASRFTAGHEHVGLLSRIAGLVEHFHIPHSGPGTASKLLSVVEYPVEHLVGVAGLDWFRRWEQNKHPSVIRWFPPEGGLSVGEPLTPTNWPQLTGGPALLFIHGIFSSCESGFRGIGQDTTTWPELRSRYGNRIIGFDHPTASVGPADNADWLVSQIPEKVALELDIVCHSRGGLVARSIASAAARQGKTVNIRNVVFAATPNGGSQITNTTNWVHLINRISSMVTLPARFLPAPADAIAEVLAALLEVLKIVGVGVALNLPGLEAMAPGSQFLLSLGQTALTPAPAYFAAAADFEPGPVLANIFNGLDDEGDVVGAAIFDHVQNDIAVPAEGVWNPAAPAPVPGFPINDKARKLALGPGSIYWHCNYFDDPAMRKALLQWLPG